MSIVKTAVCVIAMFSCYFGLLAAAGAQSPQFALPGASLPSQSLQPKMHFVRIPQGTSLPIAIDNDTYMHALRPGDEVLAHTTEDVSLPSGEKLLAGTSIFADVTAVDTDTMFGPGRRRLSFDRVQLRDGTTFPIQATMILGQYALDALPLSAQTNTCWKQGRRFTLELTSPVQIAATGSVM